MNTTTITTPRNDRPWAAWGETNGKLTILSWHKTEATAKAKADKASNDQYFDTWGAAQTGTEFPTDPQPEPEPQTNLTANTTRCECSHWYLINPDGTIEGTGCIKSPSSKKSTYAQGHDAKHNSLKAKSTKTGGKMIRVK